MSEARDLSNAAAVVTGAGSGVGAAVCKLLAAAGAAVILAGRNEEKLNKTLAEIGGNGLVCGGDVGDSAVCETIFAKAKKHFGGADILVNNAGIMRRGAATETTDADWAEVMRTNVDGVFYMSRAAARAMKNRGGAIVNVASTCGLVGAAGLAAYCASKGAVVQLTRTMALECAAQKITVNAVCPGAIDAPMLFSAHRGNDAAEAIRRRNEAAIPLGKIATPEEVARAILYLATEPHITGATLSIDGGYTAG